MNSSNPNDLYTQRNQDEQPIPMELMRDFVFLAGKKIAYANEALKELNAISSLIGLMMLAYSPDIKLLKQHDRQYIEDRIRNEINNINAGTNTNTALENFLNDVEEVNK